MFIFFLFTIQSNIKYSINFKYKNLGKQLTRLDPLRHGSPTNVQDIHQSVVRSCVIETYLPRYVSTYYQKSISSVSIGS